MDDISKKLGISKKTIYTFIENKESLINEVVEKHIAKDQEAIKNILSNSSDAIDEMVNITKHVLVFLRHMTPSLLYDLKKYHPNAWRKIESQHFSFIEDVINKNLIRGQKEGLYRKSIDPQIISKLYVHNSKSITEEDNFPLEKFNRVTLFQEMITYHLYGIISDSSRERLIKTSLN